MELFLSDRGEVGGFFYLDVVFWKQFLHENAPLVKELIMKRSIKQNQYQQIL